MVDLQEGSVPQDFFDLDLQALHFVRHLAGEVFLFRDVLLQVVEFGAVFHLAVGAEAATAPGGDQFPVAGADDLVPV